MKTMMIAILLYTYTGSSPGYNEGNDDSSMTIYIYRQLTWP